MAVPSYVGQVGSFYASTTVSTVTITTTSDIKIGDTCFVVARGGNSSYVNSITDSAGNIYKLITRYTSAATNSLYAAQITNDTPVNTVITINYVTAFSNQQGYAFVFRNLSTIAQASSNGATSVTSITTNSITPNQVDGIILAIGSNNGQSLPTQSTSGFTTLSLTSASDVWTSVAWKQMSSSTISSTSVFWNIGLTANVSSSIVAINATSGEFFALF